jgi:hypothetical protein
VVNLGLLHIGILARGPFVLAGLQKSQKSSVRCWFLPSKTLSETSYIKPKSNTTNSTLQSTQFSKGLRDVQIKVSGTSRPIFRRGFLLKTGINR